MRHSVKRDYFLHIKRCKDYRCNFCGEWKNPNSQEILDSISNFGTIPEPMLFNDLYNAEHYPMFLDIANSP